LIFQSIWQSRRAALVSFSPDALCLRLPNEN
jgi:hypothetical protein